MNMMSYYGLSILNTYYVIRVKNYVIILAVTYYGFVFRIGLRAKAEGER